MGGSNTLSSSYYSKDPWWQEFGVVFALVSGAVSAAFFGSQMGKAVMHQEQCEQRCAPRTSMSDEPGMDWRGWKCVCVDPEKQDEGAFCGPLK